MALRRQAFWSKYPFLGALSSRTQLHSNEWQWPFRFKRPGVRYVRNLPYTESGKRGLLDVYVPVAAGERRPVLFQVHGGAWMVGHKSEQAQPLLHRMVESGWVGVSINYRLAPRSAFPAQMVDVKKAIAWVKGNIAEYGGDPNFIVVTGGSAGGHLSLLAGLTPNHADWQTGFEHVDTAVQGVLALYPVVDLTNRHGIRQQDNMDSFIAQRIIQQSREAAPIDLRGWFADFLDSSPGCCRGRATDVYCPRHARFIGLGRGGQAICRGAQPHGGGAFGVCGIAPSTARVRNFPFASNQPLSQRSRVLARVGCGHGIKAVSRSHEA